MVQRGGGGAEHVYLGMTISPFSRVFFIQYSLHVAYGMVELPPRIGSGRVETVWVRSRWVGLRRVSWSRRVGLRQDSSGQVASGRVASRQFVSGRVASRQFGPGRVGSGCLEAVRVRSRRVGSADFNWKHTANWLEQGKA